MGKVRRYSFRCVATVTSRQRQSFTHFICASKKSILGLFSTAADLFVFHQKSSSSPLHSDWLNSLSVNQRWSGALPWLDRGPRHVRTTSRSSFRPLARPRRGSPWLAPRRCRARRGRLPPCCWGDRRGSPAPPAGRWQLTPSRPPSCDTRRQSPAWQTPRTWGPVRTGLGLLRSEPGGRGRGYGQQIQVDHRSPDDKRRSQLGLVTASTRLSAEPRFSVSWAPSCEGTRRVV